MIGMDVIVKTKSVENLKPQDDEKDERKFNMSFCLNSLNSSVGQYSELSFCKRKMFNEGLKQRVKKFPLIQLEMFTFTFYFLCR